MSDNGTGGHLQSTATALAPGATGIPGARRPHPVAMLIVNVLTGTVTAASPAARRKLAGPGGLALSRWLAGLAALAGAAHEQEPADVTTVHAWPGTAGAETGLWAQCSPIDYRSQDCLLVVLRDDAPADAPAVPGRPAADPSCAAFTLDAVGRVDSWGPGAQRLTGHPTDDVLGNDTTLLHPAPARLAGEPHRTLTDAYRSGEHRAEGWRICGDGRVMWAQVVTCPLYDGLDRLLGFAAVMHDLTARRRLSTIGAGRGPGVHGVPAPRVSLAPGPRSRRDRRPGRVPGQRRPSDT